MILRGCNRNTLRKSCPSATFSYRNPTRAGQPQPCADSGRPATRCRCRTMAVLKEVLAIAVFGKMSQRT
jgi:dissimilatory sulfite reductase (desulfoviridin) alpha/beta subunit